MRRFACLLLVLLCTACPVLAYECSPWAQGELAQAETLIPSSLADANLTLPLSRGQFAACSVTLYTALTGKDAPQGVASFSDSSAPEVLSAAALGLVKGFPDGSFRPEDPLTREQAAVILVRVCDAAKTTLPTGESTSVFADAPAISPWAAEEVSRLSACGILRGVGNHQLAPRQSVSGQEALLLAARIASCPQTSGSFAAGFFAAGEGQQNVIVSPASALLCLGLAQTGAAGETRAQFDALMAGTDLATLQSALTASGEGPTIEVANSVWLDRSMHPNPAYLATIQTDFSAESQTLDLTAASTVTTVNHWVAEKTHGLIDTLLTRPLPSNIVTLLLNTLYFNGDWQQPFSSNSTYSAPFTLADGSTTQAPFMHQHFYGATYFSTPTCTGIALPYQGDGSWQMLLLLPKGALSPRDLVSTDFSALLNHAQKADVALSLPKFELAGEYLCNTALQNMGLTAAFSPPQADFTPMGTCTNGSIYLSQVIQNVYLRVDEKGTEAAAVTGGIGGTTSVEPFPPVPLSFDRPFTCCLWNTSLEQALFLGVVDNPNG